MIAGKVLSEKELQTKLKALGFAKTSKRTETGTLWKSKGKSIHVPDSYEGHYPDWMLEDLETHVGLLRHRYS